MSKPSATPITDAHACSANEHDTREFIPVDVAREKLEKPLNEANAKLAIVISELDDIGRARYAGENFRLHFRQIFQRCENLQAALSAIPEK